MTQSDFKANMPQCHAATCTVAMDCAQNCELPQFGDTQAGMCMSLHTSSGHVFGISDSAPDVGEPDAFVCHEAVGRKGGNNVASLLMMHLKKKDWLQKRNSGRELNVVMDNCGGQNMSNHVIGLSSAMAGLGHFKSMNFVFCIVCCTKSVCDRCFNTLTSGSM